LKIKQEEFVATLDEKLPVIGKNIDKNLTKKLTAVKDEYKKFEVEFTKGEVALIKITRELANGFSNILSNAFYSAYKSGKLNFDRIADAFKDMLVQMAIEYASKAFIFGALNAVTGGWAGGLLGGFSKFMGFARGGLIPGPKKLIQVNEEGEEFVMNHNATSILGTGLLHQIMAFPKATKAMLSGISFPSLPSMPQPKFAFASGGGTAAVSTSGPDISDILYEIKSAVLGMSDRIDNLELNADFDEENLAITVRKGERMLTRKEV